MRVITRGLSDYLRTGLATLFCISATLAPSMPCSAAELQVSVSQGVIAEYELDDGTYQVEIEFTVTNNGSTPLYDIRILPHGSSTIPIDIPGEDIRIEMLDVGASGTVSWIFNLHSALAGMDIRLFGRVEAIDTSTNEIRGVDFNASWGGE